MIRQPFCAPAVTVSPNRSLFLSLTRLSFSPSLLSHQAGPSLAKLSTTSHSELQAYQVLTNGL